MVGLRAVLPRRPCGLCPVGWRKPEVPETEAGRNVALFDSGMTWAGQARNVGRPVLGHLETANAALLPPLSHAELSGIARSVERYRSRWERDGRFRSRADYCRVMQRRGVESRRLKNADRDREIIHRAAAGESTRSVAAALGVSKTTAHRVWREYLCNVNGTPHGGLRPNP